MKNEQPIYLGDGVYVSRSGYEEDGLWLTTGSHRIDEAFDKIYLEPSAVRDLIAYIEGKN